MQNFRPAIYFLLVDLCGVLVVVVMTGVKQSQLQICACPISLIIQKDWTVMNQLRKERVLKDLFETKSFESTQLECIKLIRKELERVRLERSRFEKNLLGKIKI